MQGYFFSLGGNKRHMSTTLVALVAAAATIAPSWVVPEYVVTGIVVASNVKTAMDTATWANNIVQSWRSTPPQRPKDYIDPAWQWIEDESDAFVIERN